KSLRTSASHFQKTHRKPLGKRLDTLEQTSGIVQRLVDKVYATTGRNSVSEPLPCHHRSTSNVLHSRLSLRNNPSQLFKLGNKTIRINLRDTVFKIIKLRSSRLRSFLDTVHAQSDKGNSSHTSSAKRR